tara:strand:- start:1537 stop:2358 length:822 start_codon:yes stop_codon:yes gene_type:complete
MLNHNAICIIGGYDLLSKSVFKELKSKYSTVLFINLSETIYKDKNLYNYKIFELKKILDLLTSNRVRDVIFLGKLIRPNLLDFRNDGLVEKYIPSLYMAYKKGDGEVLKLVISIFKDHNFKVASLSKYTSEFMLGNLDVENTYADKDILDIEKSCKLLNSLSKYDNAQSVVSVNGYIIAIEAVEGTDSMLQRVKKLRKELNQLDSMSGLLIKKPKTNQSKFIDLPVIGPKTIKLIREANLRGLAIDYKNTIIYNKKKVLELIREFELIIYNTN